MSVGDIEFVDRLHAQLQHLLNDTQIHFSKRKKLLLQYERRNNQLRRSNVVDQKRITANYDLIRRIKKQIIEDDRRQVRERRNAHEQHRKPWSTNQLSGAVGGIILGSITIATLIMMVIIMSDRSKEKYF